MSRLGNHAPVTFNTPSSATAPNQNATASKQGARSLLCAGLVLMSGVAAAGCGTTRWSDTSRTATEQLVVSHAIDLAVSQFDFSLLAHKTVFFDSQYLDGVTDKGYISSSIRQQLFASGCLVQEDRAKADFVVEARVGASGTDRHDQLLLGTPQLTMPSLQPGVPSVIPEVPLVKKTNQIGAAKIAVFAFDRRTGEPVWQSGIAQFSSTAKNYWVFGAGPFESGNVRKRTTFGGGELGVPTFGGAKGTESEYAGETLAVGRQIVFKAPQGGPIQTADATSPANVKNSASNALPASSNSGSTTPAIGVQLLLQEQKR